MADIYKLLDPEEREAYILIERQITELIEKRLAFLREAGRKKGVIVQEIGDLKSNEGGIFKEDKNPDRQDPYKAARGGREKAYFCPGEQGCGWVKGQPIAIRFDERGIFVSGSGKAGERYHCTVCGRQIGKITYQI